MDADLVGPVGARASDHQDETLAVTENLELGFGVLPPGGVRQDPIGVGGVGTHLKTAGPGPVGRFSAGDGQEFLQGSAVFEDPGVRSDSFGGFRE